MENQIILSDDELSLIQALLEVNIRGYEKHIEVNGISSLGFQDREAFQSMKEMYSRLKKDYF